MYLYNKSENVRRVLKELNDTIDKIPVGDECRLTMDYHEFNLAKEALGWKTGLFRPWPRYRGVLIVNRGMIK